MSQLKGVITALATPFLNGKIDFGSLEKLVRHQINNGIDGFVVNGTTGESPTVTDEERREIFKRIRGWVPTGFPLIMGTGSNSTAKTMQDSKDAEKLGADGILVVVPYYNKPPQRGLLEHFKAVASHVSIPTILYNVPSRTITSLELETIKKLSEHPQIVGIKEASGNIDFDRQVRAACGKEFILLSGDDGTYDEFMESGGDGIISVASHILPGAFKNREVRKHLDLVNSLYLEANPIGVKMALHLMGIFESPECRLPLATLHDSATDKLKAEMRKEGLIR